MPLWQQDPSWPSVRWAPARVVAAPAPCLPCSSHVPAPAWRTCQTSCNLHLGLRRRAATWGCADLQRARAASMDQQGAAAPPGGSERAWVWATPRKAQRKASGAAEGSQQHPRAQGRRRCGHQGAHRRRPGTSWVPVDWAPRVAPWRHCRTREQRPLPCCPRSERSLAARRSAPPVPPNGQRAAVSPGNYTRRKVQVLRPRIRARLAACAAERRCARSAPRAAAARAAQPGGGARRAVSRRPKPPERLFKAATWPAGREGPGAGGGAPLSHADALFQVPWVAP